MKPRYTLGTRFYEDEGRNDGYIEIVNVSPVPGNKRFLNNHLTYYYFLKHVSGEKITFDCCDEEYLNENCTPIVYQYAMIPDLSF